MEDEVAVGDGWKMTSFEYQKMKHVVHSEAGRDAAKAATCLGLPAICGVDPLIRKALGDAYDAYGPNNVGYEVKAAMLKMGFVGLRRGLCPKKCGCVAKGGMIFKPI